MSTNHTLTAARPNTMDDQYVTGVLMLRFKNVTELQNQIHKLDDDLLKVAV